MFGIRRGDMPEPPPKETRGQALPEGWQVFRQPTAADVDRVCRQWGVSAHDQYNKAYLQACAINQLRAIVMPPQGSLPPEVDAALLDHEGGHAHGYSHKPNSRQGWVRHDQAPAVYSPEVVRQMLTPGTYAWGLAQKAGKPKPIIGTNGGR